jgi:frataxin-like iron-binding protein CyaY
MKRFPYLLLGLPLLALSLNASVRAAEEPVKKNWAGKRLDPNYSAPFSVAMARDAQNNIWLGTEDKGVWKFNSITKEWTNFLVKDGLGDNNAYSLCVDRLGRVWAGHLNNGVSVWNGQSWKNYSVLQGPLGERVFAIAASPSGGDVWMATNAGLTRYSIQKDSWTHYTIASGLPTHKISCLAFDSLENLYVGTQCDGLVIGRSETGYSRWDHIEGAKEMPDAARGQGLPSNLITDVLVADDDRLYVATTSGLAISTDFGHSFEFWRGADYRPKLAGLYSPRPVRDIGNIAGELLREDYITNIAEDEKGLLWIGYRLKGFEVRRPLSNQTHFASATDEKDRFSYVSTLLPLGDGTSLIASYNSGLSLTDPVPPFIPNVAEKKAISLRRGWKVLPEVVAQAAPPTFPKAAGVPTKAELEALLKEVEAANQTAKPTRAPFVVPLDDDWTTQGDWLGRYGRHFAVLCAMNSPYDYVWGAGKEKVEYSLVINPRQKGNSIRYWIHWLQTKNPRVLEMPTIFSDSRRVQGLSKEGETRRQSEVDDNGEVYPLTKEGPNVYASLKIPAGTYVLSFYNHNKDGHAGFNRARDYKITIRTHPENVPLQDVTDFEKWPELAHNRQRDFWGGVYQKYLVRGPQSITVEYAKNNSFNTILASVMLDKVDERSGGQEPEPYFNQVNPQFSNAEPKLPEAEMVSHLWNALEKARTTNPVWWAGEQRRFYEPLARWHENARKFTNSQGTPRLLARLGTCHYYLNSFPKWEETQRKRNLIPARDIEADLHFDAITIKSNGSENFSGKGRKTVRSYFARLNPVPTTKATSTERVSKPTTTNTLVTNTSAVTVGNASSMNGQTATTR